MVYAWIYDYVEYISCVGYHGYSAPGYVKFVHYVMWRDIKGLMSNFGDLFSGNNSTSYRVLGVGIIASGESQM